MYIKYPKNFICQIFKVFDMQISVFFEMLFYVKVSLTKNSQKFYGGNEK